MQRAKWMLLGLVAFALPATGCTHQWVRGLGDHVVERRVLLVRPHVAEAVATAARRDGVARL